MDYLKLDVRKVRENVRNTSDQLTKYKTTTNDYFDELKVVDKFWIDASSSVFVQTVADDQEYFKELTDAIKKQITNISGFCDELESRITPFFNASSLQSVKFINSTTNQSIEILGQISSKINEIRADISTLSVPSGSSCRSAIANLASGLDTRVVSETANTIREAVRALNQVVSTAKERALSEPKYEMDANTMTYNGKISRLSLGTIKEVQEKDYFSKAMVQKGNLNEIRHTVEQTDVGYGAKIKDNDINDISAKPKYDNYLYQDKTKDRDINDIEAPKTNDNFDYKDKINTIELNDLNQIDSQEYGYEEKVRGNNLNDQVSTAEERDYKAASKDTTKKLFEGGDDVIEAGNEDYEYKNDVGGFDLNHEVRRVNSDYDYKDNTQILDLNTEVNRVGNDEFEYSDKTDSMSLKSDVHDVVNTDFSNDNQGRVFDLDSQVVDNRTSYDNISNFDELI